MSNTVPSEEPSGELVKELYAQFGLAYSLGECLHRTLCHIHALVSFEDRKDITRPRVEEKLSYAYSLTLGQVKDEIKGLVPQDLFSKLDKGVEKRNFLAHDFWFERVHLMLSTTGLHSIFQELDEYCSLFCGLDEMASTYLAAQTEKFGLTDGLLQACLDDVISGKPMRPLLQKRKLRKRERITRAWEFTMADGGKPLIFESADGELWQLCDVGLGWTHYDQVEPDWQENEIIGRYLPADINPRPKYSKPWHYEFSLARGALLWVRPGKPERSFAWGIQTKRGIIGQNLAADQKDT
jgi:hypothetical protein